MSAALPIIMFIVGVAAGSGFVWFLVRSSVEHAREQERNIALADIRVANERVTAKDTEISRLEAEIEQKDDQIKSLTEEKARLERAQAVLETSSQKDHEKFEEKIQLVNKAEEQFKNAFKVLAAEALTKNNEEFDKRSEPLSKTLDQIKSKIEIVDSSAKDLSVETSKLVKALQKPDVRGQWGEMHLRRVVEITGMTEHCDFHEQLVIGEECSQQRPDLVIHLPGNRNLAVDAKAPIQAFLDAAQAVDDETRQAKLADFVRHVRERIKLLGGKAYHQNLDSSPEFVVLYLPTEAIYTTAMMLDAGLMEYAAEKYRIHLAGPTTFLSLVRIVAYDWRQDAVAKNAGQICELAEELYKRLATFGGHMGKVGASLNKSVSAYNQAVGSLESRIMPQARRFEQLGAAPDDIRIEELAQIESMAKDLQREELLTADANGELADASSTLRPR